MQTSTYLTNGCIFKLFQILKNFQMFLRRTFLDMFWSKQSCLIDNPIYKTNANLISYIISNALRMQLKKALIQIYVVTVSNDIVIVCILSYGVQK